MIVISKHMVPKGFAGLAIYPFIFVKRKELKEDIFLINHEQIHLRQQQEMLLLFFYVFYGIEWLVKCIKYRSSSLAYKNLSFEREAYAHESNLNYLLERKIWAFLRYL